MKRTVQMHKMNAPSNKALTKEGSKFKGFKYGGGNRPANAANRTQAK